MASRRSDPLRGGLLVGGASRRFGSAKALAVLRGRTFAERVAAALGSAVGELSLLGDGEVPPALAGLRRLADAAGVRGPLAGVLGALRAEPHDAWLIAACDQPLLDAAALAWLAGQRQPGAIAVVARLADGPIEPLPGLFEPAARATLERLARSGGSMQPLGERADVVVARPPAALAAAWSSVDTPAALARLAAAPGD